MDNPTRLQSIRAALGIGIDGEPRYREVWREMMARGYVQDSPSMMVRLRDGIAFRRGLGLGLLGGLRRDLSVWVSNWHCVSVGKRVSVELEWWPWATRMVGVARFTDPLADGKHHAAMVNLWRFRVSVRWMTG